MNNISRVLAVVIAMYLAGCGDDHVPASDAGTTSTDSSTNWPPTWRYAEERWADAWCSYVERCYPADFERIYNDQYTCGVSVVEQNCKINAHGCDTLFPIELLGDLMTCHDQMREISCLATDAPTICLAVWQ